MGYLQKCAEIAKLCDDLSGDKNYKVFFDNWFTALDPLHHFRSKEIHDVPLIQLKRLRDCPVDSSRYLMENNSDTVDYCCDSGIMAVKCVNNSMVREWENRKGEGEKKHSMSQKSMGGVDLADMLLSLYEYCARQSTDTKRYSAISLVWPKSMLGFYTLSSERKTTKESEIFTPIQSWAITFSDLCQQSESI